MIRHHKCGFGCTTKHELPSQLIPVARLTLDEKMEDMVCEEDQEDDVMPSQISWPMPISRKCQ